MLTTLWYKIANLDKPFPSTMADFGSEVHFKVLTVMSPGGNITALKMVAASLAAFAAWISTVSSPLFPLLCLRLVSLQTRSISESRHISKRKLGVTSVHICLYDTRLQIAGSSQNVPCAQAEFRLSPTVSGYLVENRNVCFYSLLDGWWLGWRSTACFSQS